jgi:hypothetical protein
MMRDDTRFRSAVSSGLALLLCAMASVPLWHAPHPANAEQAVEPAHCHSDLITFCDDGASAPDTECALCLTKRLLAQSLADRADESSGPPPGAGALVESILDTGTGDRLVFSARGPPLS